MDHKIHVRSHMRECGLEEISGILPQEDSIGDIWIGNLRRVEQGNGNLICMHQLKHASKEDALQLEPALVICVGKNKEDILHDAEEVLLEECVLHRWIRTRKVVYDLQTNYKQHVTNWLIHLRLATYR